MQQLIHGLKGLSTLGSPIGVTQVIRVSLQSAVLEHVLERGLLVLPKNAQAQLLFKWTHFLLGIKLSWSQRTVGHGFAPNTPGLHGSSRGCLPDVGSTGTTSFAAIPLVVNEVRVCNRLSC